MRLTWGALLLLLSSNLQAAAPTLRFAIADSWTMPAVAIDGGQPSTGILYDTMGRLAQHLGAQAEFHVLARARMQKPWPRAKSTSAAMSPRPGYRPRRRTTCGACRCSSNATYWSAPARFQRPSGSRSFPANASARS